MNPGANQALKNYQTVGAHASVAAADPHRLVQLMLDNILQRLAAAGGHLERGEVARKGEQTSKAIAVISALDGSLNFEQGGDLAATLAAGLDSRSRGLLINSSRGITYAGDGSAAAIRAAALELRAAINRGR